MYCYKVIRQLAGIEMTYKHKGGGDMVCLNMLVLIKPHLFSLDLPGKRRKLLCHTVNTEKQ